MHSEKNSNCLVSILLATVIAAGSVGCMVTGLGLNVRSLHSIVMICFACAAVASLCYRFRYGGWVLRLICLGGMVWFLQDMEHGTIWLEQARVIANRMTTLWNHAYGWPVISLRAQRVCDWPMTVVGGFIAIAVSRTVCRQKRAAFPVLTALLPLGSCLVVTDTVPETPWLFALLLGLAVLMLTNSIRRRDLRQGLELTLMASAAAAVSLGALLMLCPQESYVNRTGEIQGRLFNLAQELPSQIKEWGQELVDRDVQTVQARKENLDSLGDRIQRGYTVLEVQTTYDGILYLRGQDFDGYDGKSWTATRNRSEYFYAGQKYPMCWSGISHQVNVTTRTAKDVRYVPYYPAYETVLTGGKLENAEHALRYSFSQTQLLPDWEMQMMLSSTYYPESDIIYATTDLYDSGTSVPRYRALPLETKTRAEALLGTVLTGEEASVTEKVEAIRSYVQNSAVYSLTPDKMPEGEQDFALWFLEKGSSGYCVHFATATVVLLRAAGIDARYVTGYACKTVAGRTVAVPASQAHAWAEYYVPSLDVWLPVEATPPDQFLSDPEFVEEPSSGEDELPEITLPPQPSAEAPEETEPVRETGPSEATTPTGGGEGQAQRLDLSGLVRVLKCVLFTALTVGAVLGQYRLRRHLREKRCAGDDPNSRALALWREVAGLHRLLKEPPPEHLEALAHKAKFSQYAMDDGELAAFRTDIRESVARLEANAWFRKLIYRLIFAAY